MLGIVVAEFLVPDSQAAMTGSNITIRAATSTDSDAMTGLLQAADLPVTGVADTPGNFLVAEENGLVVALGGLEAHPPDALLRSLAVDRTRRNDGLGRLVFDRLWQQAGAARYSGVYLLTTTAADYFERLGFARIERDQAPDGIRRSAEFARLCPDDAVLMLRSVTG